MLRVTAGGGNEDYASIQEAIDSVPYNTKAEIIVSEGIYEERLFSDKSDLVLRGEGSVIVRSSQGGYDRLGSRKRGTFRSATAFFSGERLRLENLAIVNDAGPVSGQALALYLDVREAFLDRVTLNSFQDTLFLAPLPDEEREKGGFYGPRHLLPRRPCRTVVTNSLVSGTVDFIFGGGDALFEGCRIVSRGPGYIAAPSGRKDGTGLVFHRSVFTGTGPSYLMRPWRPEGKASFIECSFGEHIAAGLIAPWPGLEDELGRASFALYGSGVPDNISAGEAASILSAFSH